jgi:hypothetical protein
MNRTGRDRREQWLREVLRSPRLHPQTKVVLVVMYRHMRTDCKVSVSRRTIADQLGWRHIQRVSERITAAHDAGFLVTVIEGSYGRTATWQGVFPDRITVRPTRTVRESKNPDGYDPSNRPGFPDTITKADPSHGHRPQRRQRWEEQTA